MRVFLQRWLGSIILGSIALLLVSALAVAQAAPGAETVESPVAVPLASGRPTITVTDFDFGTVAAQISSDKRARKQLEKMGVKDTYGFAAQLGVGAADLIVEKLLTTSAFRILERKQLAAIQQEQGIGSDPVRADSVQVALGGHRVTRARYIVSGSVTRLGFEERHLGGILGRAASPFVYGLGAKKNITEVFLTARVIDTESGEIVASFTGEGVSDKGWGLTMFGMGGWGLGGGKIGSSNIRESAIGEATARAAQSVSGRIARISGQLVTASTGH